MSEETGVEKYLRLIEHDFGVLELLTASAERAKPPRDVSDWQVTLIFYITCIYVKALGRSFGRDIQDHYGLRQWLNTEPDLLVIARPYRHIEEPSRDARYEGRTFDRDFILKRIVPHFVLVRNHLAGLLEKRGATAVPRVDPAPLFADGGPAAKGKM